MPPVTLPSTSLVSCSPNETPYWLSHGRTPHIFPSMVLLREIPPRNPNVPPSSPLVPWSVVLESGIDKTGGAANAELGDRHEIMQRKEHMTPEFMRLVIDFSP